MVPWEHAGPSVWVRAGERMVEIYRSRQGDRIEVHTRLSGVNRYAAEVSHLRPLHRKIRERLEQEARPKDYRDWLIHEAWAIGPEALQWTRASLASRDSPQQAYRAGHDPSRREA